MCFPVKKKRGRSSLALAVWNSSLSLNLHSSSSSSLLTVCLSELRSALITHRVAPAETQTTTRRLEQIWSVLSTKDCVHCHLVLWSNTGPGVLRTGFFPRNHMFETLWLLCVFICTVYMCCIQYMYCIYVYTVCVLYICSAYMYCIYVLHILYIYIYRQIDR